jgi:hypothetical protein
VDLVLAFVLLVGFCSLVGSGDHLLVRFAVADLIVVIVFVLLSLKGAGIAEGWFG